jgi:hypothetical protein
MSDLLRQPTTLGDAMTTQASFRFVPLQVRSGARIFEVANRHRGSRDV